MAVPLGFLLLLTAVYLTAAFKERKWSIWRTASWMSGAGILAWGLLPQFLPFSPGDFRQHMLQHLMLGMLAPIGLVMAAPITLLLRALPVGQSRIVIRILQTRTLKLWANPVTALVFNLGGMAALYFTSLFVWMMTNPALHYLVHFHFVVAGCLYAWVIAGPDPAPDRPSVPSRLVVLGIAVVLHSVMAQMLYARVLVSIPVPTDQLQQAAELMYYGGDITELLLAFAMVSTWRPSRGKTPGKGQLQPQAQAQAQAQAR